MTGSLGIEEKRRDIIYGVLYKITISLLFLLIFIIVFDILIPALLPPEYRSVFEERINIMHLISYLSVFLSLNIVDYVLGKHPVAIPIRLLSKFLLLLIVLDALSYGKLHGSIVYNDYVISIYFDISKPLYVLIIITLVLGFLDAFKKISGEEV